MRRLITEKVIDEAGVNQLIERVSRYEDAQTRQTGGGGTKSVLPNR
jgi:hypothetical protein